VVAAPTDSNSVSNVILRPLQLPVKEVVPCVPKMEWEVTEALA